MKTRHAEIYAKRKAKIAPKVPAIGGLWCEPTGEYAQELLARMCAPPVDFSAIPFRNPAKWPLPPPTQAELDRKARIEARNDAYYATGHKISFDGAPCRWSPLVREFSPWMRRALGRGTPTRREDDEAKAQFKLLFPAVSAPRRLIEQDNALEIAI